MEKIKSLLLPFALVFAAIAVFEFGARYGATNMRAYAIASELQFPLGIYVQAQSNLDAATKEAFSLPIDNGIAAGVLHRELWYLDKDAKAALDKALAYALSIRGDAAAERFAKMEASEDAKGLSAARIKEIQELIESAKIELVDNAPSVAEKEAAAADQATQKK